MSDNLLRAPHWRLFIYSFGVPFLLQLLGTMFMLSGLSEATAATIPSWTYYVFAASSLAVAIVWYGWTWAVGSGLQQRMPQELRRGSFGFGVVVFTLVVVALASIYTPAEVMLSLDESEYSAALYTVFVLFFGLWVAAHIYCAHYIALGILTAEADEIPDRQEVIRLTLLIWLFPVGVWVVQPRINQLARRELQPAVSREAAQMEPSVVRS